MRKRVLESVVDVTTTCDLGRLDGVKVFTLWGLAEIGVCGSKVKGRLGAEGGDSDEESCMRISAQILRFENFKQFSATDQESNSLDYSMKSQYPCPG